MIKQLEAPKEYFKLNEKEKSKITNQCGPNNVFKNIIPNSLIGVDVSKSCDIHDYMIHTSKTNKHVKEADNTFLKNVKTQINAQSGGILNVIRKGIAHLCYLAVRAYSVITKRF